MKRVRQGQTRWKAVVYEPGKIEGFDDSFVAYVYPCRVEKAEGSAVRYRCGYGGNLHSMPYICSDTFWHKKLHKTYRAAFRASMVELNAVIARVKGEQ